MPVAGMAGHDREILEAAETWATARKALWDLPEKGVASGRYNALTEATTHLFNVVMAKREAIQRAMEFGPTPAEGSTYEDRLNVLEDRLDALDNQRIVELEDRLDSLVIAKDAQGNQIRSQGSNIIRQGERIDGMVDFVYKTAKSHADAIDALEFSRDSVASKTEQLRRGADRLEEERLELTVRVNQICSFLGPAFQEWKGR